jgi:hypothetical protein
MTPSRRNARALWGMVILAVGLCGGAQLVAARAVLMGDACHSGDAHCALGPRVRSTRAYLRAMIEEAARRSPTFRHLVAAIEATNGIVYVEHGSCRQGVHACLALTVTAAGDYRILRVTVDARQPDWDVMALIGHELRHAIEVLENSTLADTTSAFQFYAQQHHVKDRPFETSAAIEAEDAVRKDVSTFAKGYPKAEEQ